MSEKKTMVNADGSTDWRLLREFAAVELTQSFILSWHLEGAALCIDIDVQLTPDHPFYEEPRPAEKVCIRPALIEFPHARTIEADGVSASQGVSEAITALRLGAISGLRRLADGRYELEGGFGVVLIAAERPILRLKRLPGNAGVMT
jgi:hypothetical protein